MTKLLKNEVKILAKYETHLKRALDGYVKGIYHSDLNELEPIYNRMGQHLENRSCSTCVLGMLIFLANKYFADDIVKN